MTRSWHRLVTAIGRYSTSVLVGLSFFAVALLFTAIGSVALIMECVAIGFVVALMATIASAIGIYGTVRGGRGGLGIAFWTLLSSLVVLAYDGVIAVPWAFPMLFRG